MKERKVSAYQQKLLDPRWQRKRLEILERDGWKCLKCHDTETTLHVHHRYYLNGKDPWEYDATLLLTLCEHCHEEETRFRAYAEQELLHSLNRVGFSHTGLLDLASAFDNWQCIKPEAWSNYDAMTSNIHALFWALQNHDIMGYIHEQYLVSREKAEEPFTQTTSGE
jgi:hypothetical protein